MSQMMMIYSWTDVEPLDRKLSRNSSKRYEGASCGQATWVCRFAVQTSNLQHGSNKHTVNGESTGSWNERETEEDASPDLATKLGQLSPRRVYRVEGRCR